METINGEEEAKKVNLLIMASFSMSALASFIFVSSAFRTKPGEEANPDGFPSGEHFNLNIIGKKPEFTPMGSGQ